MEAMSRPSEVSTAEDVIAAMSQKQELLTQAKHVKTSTGSAQSLEQISAWLDKCKFCAYGLPDGKSKSFVPKRLMQIGKRTPS